MPAVCSICYHSFKYKYGLGPDDSEHQVIKHSTYKVSLSETSSLAVREVLNRKNGMKFHTREGGHFHTFFFTYSNSFKSAKKVYFVGGGGTTSPESRKILDISVLNYSTFLG